MEKIEKVKHELQRVYDLTLNKKGSEQCFAIHKYVELLETTPFLKKVLEKWETEWRGYEDGLRENVEEDRDFFTHLSNYGKFNPFSDYLGLYYKVFTAIDDLRTETNPERMDALGLALSKNKKSIMALNISDHKKSHVMEYKKLYCSSEYDAIRKSKLKNLHEGLLKILLEIELTPNKFQQKEQSKVAKQLKITAETKWNDLEISFSNAHQIGIKHANFEAESNYEEMGFEDKRKDSTPNKSWKFFQLLSMKDGLFPLNALDKKKKEALKKRKQELSSTLKACFGINDDPFEKITKETKSYKLKFKIRPEPESRESWLDKNIFDE